LHFVVLLSLDNRERQIAAMTRGRRILRRILIWIPLALLLALLVFLLTPLGRYLARAGVAEAQILLARRPIALAVTDSSLGVGTRGKLALVLEARQYAQDSLGLRAKKSFTQFTQLDRDTLVLVLSAAPRDQLVPHLWWFPIVGRLPYKGYFDFARASAEAQGMSRDGYDVNLRPASAFSTLGWFNDPLLSTTLAADSVDLVDTVIHELIHNTFFARDQAVFNESFANFAGARGAAAFFRSRGDMNSAREAEERWHDQHVLGTYWAKLFRELDSAFRAHPDDKARRLVIRDSVYAAARTVMLDSLSKELLGVPRQYLERVRLDNAALLGRRVYATDLELFDAVLEAERGNVRSAIDRVITIAEESPGNPAAALRDWVQRQSRQ
jgi:predicted aminopeptidase